MNLQPNHGKELVEPLFSAVCMAIFCVGGDGDGLIVSEQYRELAELFEKHKMHECFSDRWNHGVMISYLYGQSAIHFVHPDDWSQPDYMDIVVNLRWPIL